MRLLSWLLCVVVAMGPVFTAEEGNILRQKRDSSEKKIVCYYTNWSVYRPGTAKFSPQNINPYLCTHLVYAFGGLSKDNALKPFDKYQDIEQGGYAKFNGLKTYNKNLKTMLAIGGWNEGSARFSPLVADGEKRRELVKNTVKFLRQNHFDGLDLDWEYPSFRDGGKPRDRDNYATLVQEFREEFERESEKTGRPRLLLTMAVPAGIDYIDKGYDIPKLNKYLDWMNILSYDYHSAFEPAINHHSPLFSLEEDDEYNFDAVLNINHTVHHYLKLGAYKNKLVLGIPTYGRSYTLFNRDATDIGSPADGPGEQGEATREKGYLAYYEICERVRSGGWTLENPNPEVMGPYAYKDNQWVGFDDEDIVRTKAKYVNDNDLGGIMFWSIDNDDFRGKCHGKPYPLIEAAKEVLLANANELAPSAQGGSSKSSSKKAEQETSSQSKTRKSRLRAKSSTTTATSNKLYGRTSTTPQPPTTPDPGSDFICKDEGFFPHPRDCKKYFWCLDSGPSSLGIVAHQFTCPSGLVFNKISDSCDYARNVICKTKSETSTTTTTTTTSTSTTTTTSRTTTAKSRLVITASPPKGTSTSTIIESPSEEEEKDDEEEDPGTIKELINLIKKLGGVEQLEKQLNLQNSEGKEKIKPSLYSRVLQGRTANRYRGVTEETTTSKYVSVFRNRPVGPQSPNTEETSTVTRGPEKPRYVTIQRNRSTKKPVKTEEEDEEWEKEEEEEEELREETPRPFRKRPTTDVTTEKEYFVLRRSRLQKEDENISTPKYKNIVRVRSTTEAALEEEKDEDLTEKEEKIEEEKREEIETGQKLKKYSSIIRDSKKLVAEEESKVSGPKGPQYEIEVSSSTTDSALEERNYVNTVNKVTSPMYVEIKRTQPTSTEPSENNVYSVYNLNNYNQENDLNEVYKNQSESGGISVSGFQRRITTETVRSPTRPPFKSATLAKTTSIITDTFNKMSRFRERFTTETFPTLSTKPINKFETLIKNTQEDRIPKQEKSFKTTAVEITPPSEASRRFQFAPRTKPSILPPKSLESTTEVFKITVPNLPSHNLSVKSVFSTATLSTTLKPFITTPFFQDSIILTTPEGNDLAFSGKKLSFSTDKFSPTTSTQTSVVTSITESSFTERKRIFVSKKNRLNTESKFSANLVTVEQPFEITKPLFRESLNKFNSKFSILKSESTTETRKRIFKTKTNTNTTEVPLPVKKYRPRKTRIFKQISSTEVPQVTSSTIEKIRYRLRNKPRQTENGPLENSNTLQRKFNTLRKKKIFSKEEDDLEVQQTAAFFENDFESNDRYILGGTVKQTSGKDFLNADVFFRTVPTMEEEEKPAYLPGEELMNSLAAVDKKKAIKNRFITVKPVLKNLRTRTRKLNESSSVAETSSGSSLDISRNNFFTSNAKTSRGRTQPVIKDGGLKTPEANTSSVRPGDFSDSVQRLKARKIKFQVRNRLSGVYRNASHEKSKDPILENGGFGIKSTSTVPENAYESQTAGNDKNLQGRTHQFKVTSAGSGVGKNAEEPGLEEPMPVETHSRFNAVHKTTESLYGLEYVSNLRNSGVKYRHFKENLTDIPTEEISVGIPTKTNNSPTYSTPSPSQKTTKESSQLRSYEVTTYPSLMSAVSEFSLRTESELVSEKEDHVTNSTLDSGFGTKITVAFSPTVSSILRAIEYPANRTAGTTRGTFIITTPQVENLKIREISGTSESINQTPSLGKPKNSTIIPNFSSVFKKVRTRMRQDAKVVPEILENTQNLTEESNSLSNPRGVLRTRGKVKAIDSIFQETEAASIKTVGENGNGRTVFPKKGKKVLFRSRPVQSTLPTREEENELEPSEDVSSTTSKTGLDKRGNQDYYLNLRNRGKTPVYATDDNTERKRTQLDRRRFRGESRVTIIKPGVQTEVHSSTSRPNVFSQRKKLRPSTTPTTTTTEEHYIVQQEDSRLKESKGLDETRGIQDLADPAVVAIHNLATISPGPLPPAVTSSFSQTPASYTVHVTPSDIASFSTPANPISVTPGSVSSRPTSILTLKPYTIPLITRQYVTKQTPPFRAASTLRESGFSVPTKEPYNSNSEILVQSRKQEAVQRKTPIPFANSSSQKEEELKYGRLKPFSKLPKQEMIQSASSPEPPVDYEYYDDNEDPLAKIPASALKVKVHSDGYIECLDRGNFPHPFSCKKFISCAKMENNELLGWEYTCPKHLSFDPVGGICNWSAGLGCQH